MHKHSFYWYVKFHYICRKGFVEKVFFLLPGFKISTFCNHGARLGVNMTSWRGMYILLNYPIYISYFIYHSFYWSRIRSYFSDDFIFVTVYMCIPSFKIGKDFERKITLLPIQQNISWWSDFFFWNTNAKLYNSRHIVCINVHSHSFHQYFSELNSYFYHVSLFRDVRRRNLLK